MDATQQIEDSFYGEEDDADEEHEAGEKRKEREPVAALKVFKNSHIAEMEVPLYLGENVLGRDPASCPVPLQARSVSSRHAVISISAFPKDRRGPGDVTEALLWDLGSLNGTRKGRIKLTPHVRYAVTEGDSVVLADLPCQYVGLKDVENVHTGPAAKTSSSSEEGLENGRMRNVLPPVPVWSDDKRSPESPRATPKQPERTLVPESDSDSDGERPERRVSKKRLASDSASSDLSSPTFSTLLTPASKIIPESEDESSITPSSAPRGEKCAEVSSESPKPDPLNFNLDSDTDVEDEQAETTKAEPEVKTSVPVNLHADSDTDEEDEDVLKAKSGPGVEAKQDEDALTLDSDTDVEENEPLRTEAIPTKPVSAEFNMDSDTDAEDEVPHSRRPTVPQTDLLLDSDTDADENDETKNISHEPSNQDKPVEALESDSDTDLEVDAPVGASEVTKNSEARHESPAEVSDFRMDSNTDVEEDDKVEEGAPQCGEAAAGIPHSSTPRGAGMSEDETQAYLSPSQPFKRPVLPSLLCPPVSSGDISHEDEDFAVAETQSFVSEAAPADATLDETPQLLVGRDSRHSDGDSSFKLGLSESVHRPPETEKDQELTQEDWHLQSTQLYAANFEGNTKAGQTQLDLEATQAYEAGTDQDKEEETLPVDFVAHPSVFTAETQLMAKNEEDNSARGGNGLAVAPERGGREEKEDEALVDSHLSTADTLLIVRSPRREEASQPYAFLAALKKQDERNQDVPAGLEQGREEGLQKADEEDKEQTQPVEPDNTHVTIAETQPIGEEQEEEPQNEAGSSKSPERGNLIAAVEPTRLDDSHVATAEGEESKEEERQDVPDFSSTSRMRQATNVDPTQPLEADMSEDEEEQEVEPQKKEEADEEPLPTGKNEPTRPLEIAETQPMCEDREEEGQIEPSSAKTSRKGRRLGKADDKAQGEDAKPRRRTGRLKQAAKVEQTQLIESNTETLPLCEDEDGQDEEPDREEAQPSRRTGRGSTVEPTQPLESDDTHAEDKEIQEEERQDEPSSSKRSRRGRAAGKAQDKEGQREVPRNENSQTSRKTGRGRKAGEDEDKEEPQSEEAQPSRRTGRGRPAPTVEPTQPLESDNAHTEIAETLPLCEDKHGQEEGSRPEEAQPSRRTGRGRPAATVEPTQPLESDDTHDKDKDIQEEERQDEPSPSKRSRRGRHPGKTEDENAREVEAQIGEGKPTAEAEPTQPSESDNTHAEIAETVPLCEDEDGQEPSRKAGRGRPAAEPTQPLESDKEIQEEEGQDEPSSSKRSRRGRAAGKEEPRNENSQSSRKTGRGRKAGKDEDEEAQKEEPQSEESRPGRRTGRGRRASKVEPTQPLEMDYTCAEIAETLPLCQDEQKTLSSRRTGRAKPTIPGDKVDQPTGEGEEGPVEEPKSQPSSSKRSRRGKSIAMLEPAQPKESGDTYVVAAGDEEGQKEERQSEASSRSSQGRRASKVEPAQPIDLGSNTPQMEKDKDEGNGKSRRGRGRVSVAAATEGKKKEEENGDGEVDMGRKGRGPKNTRQKFNDKKDGVETERAEATREKEDKPDELLDQERKEKEAIERLEEEAGGQPEKENVKEDLQKKEQGKQRTEREKKLKEENEVMERRSTENTLQDKEEAKPKQGRCTARKSLAPPAGAADDDDVPAKRTRSRSNSSNSVCSEQSTSIVESQAGGRRGGRRNAERARPSRKSAAAPPSQKEDTVQITCSRSNSRSSDRSGTSVADPNQNSRAKGRKSVKVEEREVEIGQKPGRGRGRGGKRDVKTEATDEAATEDSVVNQTSSRGRKRGADTTTLTEETPQPTPKTPRRSLAEQTPKVLFTGVTDENAEKAVVRLGGALAKGVSDMTHLVTDKVRRTVKFLCAVAKGVPIVTPDWLNKCGKAGSFLSTNGFLVKDVEQERKFNFKLRDALRAANHHPLLLGYEIHVTPSVKPEPVQMKEIITCCGARYLPKMPSAHKAQTVVVSCQEDRAQCEKARSLSLPLVSAEFLLTGILQQTVDLQAHLLPLSPAATKLAARSRGK